MQLEQPVFTFGRLLRPRLAVFPSSEIPEASLRVLSVPLLEARDEESSGLGESEGIGDRSNVDDEPMSPDSIR